MARSVRGDEPGLLRRRNAARRIPTATHAKDKSFQRSLPSAGSFTGRRPAMGPRGAARPERRTKPPMKASVRYLFITAPWISADVALGNADS